MHNAFLDPHLLPPPFSPDDCRLCGALRHLLPLVLTPFPRCCLAPSPLPVACAARPVTHLPAPLGSSASSSPRPLHSASPHLAATGPTSAPPGGQYNSGPFSRQIACHNCLPASIIQSYRIPAPYQNTHQLYPPHNPSTSSALLTCFTGGLCEFLSHYPRLVPPLTIL